MPTRDKNEYIIIRIQSNHVRHVTGVGAAWCMLYRADQIHVTDHMPKYRSDLYDARGGRPADKSTPRAPVIWISYNELIHRATRHAHREPIINNVRRYDV